MRSQRVGFVVGAVAVVSVLSAPPAPADVTETEVSTWRAQKRAENAEKKLQKKLRRTGASSAGSVGVLGSGSQSFVDASGLEFFINTDITYSTSSSASAAASEASYTGPVIATTSGGGTESTTLSDAFDGYGSVCLSQTATGPCSTGSADYVIYNENGAPTADASCNGRQLVFNPQSIYGLTVTRKVFVPVNDTFARWMTILSNPTAAPVTVNVVAYNNVGSDSSTLVDSSSSGDAVATTADYWVTTYESFSSGSSSDPRLGHVMWGQGAAGPNAVVIANGGNNPYWSIPVTVPAGGTRVVVHFVTGQPSRAAARAKAALLAANPLPPTASACMTDLERTQLVNFAAAAAGEPPIPSLGLGGLLGLVAAIGATGLLAHRRLV